MNGSVNVIAGPTVTNEVRCPVSGLVVVKLPDFTDILLSGDHYATFSKIGHSIVCIECRGYQGNFNVEAMDLLNNSIEQFCIRTGVKKPYVQVYNKKAETGKHSLSILRREVAFFRDNQDTIAGLVLLQGKTWLNQFTNFAMRLYKPSMKILMVDTYADSILSAQHILSSIQIDSSVEKKQHQRNMVCFEDVLFNPELEYRNDQTGFAYSVGIVPHRLVVHSLHNDMSGMDDVRKSSELLEKCYKSNELLKDHQYSIVDLTNISGKTPLIVRIAYSKEIRRLNYLYNLSNVTQIIITNSKFYRNAGKLFFYMVRQKAFVADTFSEAFAIINEQSGNTHDIRDHNKDINVSAEDLDELNTVFSHLLLTDSEEEFEVSEKNPLKYLTETIQLIRQDIVDLREKDRLHAEERLKESEKTRIQLLEMMQNLELATARAEAASKAKSEFLVNMSHEIRTPLNGVIGFTDLLKSTPLSSVQMEYVENANVSGHALLGVINDILDFSKIEAGMFHLEMIKTDLVVLLEECADIVKYGAGIKNLEILLNIDTATPRFAVTDPIRLKQVLANLMGNAVKFTSNGEVELKVSCEYLADGKGKLFFSVRDTGIGISDDSKDKLFKAFSQADSSTTRKFGGTGLGLIISDMIARKMGSKIHFNSKLGEGTTFYFELVTEIEMEQKPQTDTLINIKSCLIVDDNASSRLILEQMLTNWNIVCKSFDNGLSALMYLETSEPFDCIICDYHMPKVDGLKTIQLIREHLKLTPENLKIILLHSSNDCSEFSNRCDELGVRFRLSKPIKGRELFHRLLRINTPSSDHNKPEAVNATEYLSLNLNGKPVKILIVEDVKMNMLVIKALLVKILPDAELITAPNGREAIMMFDLNKPDLICMDVQMPEMDGLEATRQIRNIELKTAGRVPVIALTAGAFKEEQDKCLQAGMDDFLTKPVNPKKIKEILSKYL